MDNDDVGFFVFIHIIIYHIWKQINNKNASIFNLNTFFWLESWYFGWSKEENC